MAKERLGIYVHIPFCASKCSYCDFYSLAGCEKQMPVYHKALIDHLVESAERIRHYEVDSIYFGGGTPSYYGAERLLELFDVLKLNGNVRMDTEVTVECNPDSMDFKELLQLREEGVNRLSIGVQATNDELLKMIGRRHNWAQAQLAYQAARRAGFDNVSIDLMYGLPSQTKRDWAESLAKIVELHPEHISCYALKLEDGTPMAEDYRNSPLLPDDDEQADMYSYAAQMLERYGYKQYEISNFAAAGFESRHNLKYWRLDDYMGFGPGAHSSVGNLRYSFVKDLKKYTYGISRKVSVIDEYEVIDELERSVEYLMLGMRTNRGIEENEYRVRCQSDWKPVQRVLEAFEKKGWAVREPDGRWHFTVSGFLLSNQLIGILLEAQAGSRLDNTPWMYRPDRPEEEPELPKGEQELFAEMLDRAKTETTARRRTGKTPLRVKVRKTEGTNGR
ncbi:MAG: radical SAM family heme chaperone HemW [Oscillospiraceae bacterium]|nr:radical SAM family heme chaperone HemW [Oscillospiraceae bacterium]